MTAFLTTLPAYAAPPLHDEILTYSNGRLAKAELPAGPGQPSVAVAPNIGRLYVLPSGEVLATTLELAGPALHELRPDGSLRLIGIYPPPPEYTEAYILDMALDHRGRFHLLIAYANHPAPQSVGRLVQVDLTTGAVIEVRPALDAVAIATAPDGLWAFASFTQELRRLDPDSGLYGPAVTTLDEFGSVSDLDNDSSGRLYFHSELACSPPCPSIGTVDPSTGVAAEAPRALWEQVGLPNALAIERRCTESATARCLQGGRFRAEATFADYVSVTGAARVAPARSRDTGVFSFFDPDNWELMIKVLDGCAINGHFWVYASASTDVAFELRVTDTQTGAVKVYDNPLGQLARTVTDGGAFSCTSVP